MNTKLLLVALVGLIIGLQPISANANPNTLHNGPDIKVVVGSKRIWLMTDEVSVKSLTVQVTNEQGQPILEKHLSSKTTDWSLNIESLPKGKYSVNIGGKTMTQFDR